MTTHGKLPGRETRCRSCGAAIVHAPTPAGKTIPVDLAPVETGNIVIRDGVVRVISPSTLNVVPEPGEPRYVAHFASCPDAAGWRRSR
jgi:hypothetical protein